jgi:hypothetical protein
LTKLLHPVRITLVITYPYFVGNFENLFSRQM